jgi:26S proteasome regulatory subunit N2
MKTDEPTKHGDVSPISGSISNLVDTSKPPSRKKETTSERLQNISRVTPQQLPYISFPLDSRYQPVRPVSTSSESRPKKTAANLGETYTGIGGILVLLDERPDEPVELIAPLEPSVLAPEPATITLPPQSIQTTSGRPHIALDENLPEASPPPPFEVSSAVRSLLRYLIYLRVCSIPLAKIHRQRNVR